MRPSTHHMTTRSKTKRNKKSIQSLPTEIIWKILGYLSGMHIFKAHRVCYLWRRSLLEMPRKPKDCWDRVTFAFAANPVTPTGIKIVRQKWHMEEHSNVPAILKRKQPTFHNGIARKYLCRTIRPTPLIDYIKTPLSPLIRHLSAHCLEIYRASSFQGLLALKKTWPRRWDDRMCIEEVQLILLSCWRQGLSPRKVKMTFCVLGGVTPDLLETHLTRIGSQLQEIELFHCVGLIQYPAHQFVQTMRKLVKGKTTALRLTAPSHTNTDHLDFWQRKGYNQQSLFAHNAWYMGLTITEISSAGGVWLLELSDVPIHPYYLAKRMRTWYETRDVRNHVIKINRMNAATRRDLARLLYQELVASGVCTQTPQCSVAKRGHGHVLPGYLRISLQQCFPTPLIYRPRFQLLLRIVYIHPSALYVES